MEKILILIALLAFILTIPVACAGNFEMDVSGSGGINFYFINSDENGLIYQGYSGDGTVDYEASYSDGTLETDIDSTGPGSFTTILLPENTWSADATYTDDGSPVSDSGSGAIIGIFPHSWSNSFTGGGTYTVE